MRIGLSGTTIEPAITQGKWDGIGNYTKNLYDQFLQEKLPVTPFSFPHAKKPLYSGLLNGRFFKYSYATSVIASLINPLPYSIHGKLKSYIDIIHITDHMIPKISDIPVIATLNDGLMFSSDRHHWKSIRLGHLKQWIRKQSLAWPDHFITISHAMRTELLETCSIKENDLSVVHLGISPEWFETVPDEIKQSTLDKFQLPNNFLLFVGTLQHKKNISRLIQAFLQLPIEMQKAYPLVIVGRARFDAEESLTAIRELLKSQHGVWLNDLNSTDLRTLYQCATLHVHPSLHEGFGLTLLEAFASKTPVLTSNVAAMPEIAADAAFLIDPHDVEHIRHGLHTLLSDAELRNTLVKKGLQRVKAFSWEKCASETLKVYHQFL